MAQADLSPRILSELLHHEGLVREAYRDTAGVWTWSVGITSTSGHRVERYRDNPQSIVRCLEVFVWLLSTHYLPTVLAAFGVYPPAEHQLAAALSFHWNTGAIGRAAWLKRFLAGDETGARAAIQDWHRPPELLSRRTRERDLFFDGRWSGDGTVAVYEVAKPSYRPVRPRRMDVRKDIATLLGDKPDAPPIAACAAEPSPAPRNWFERLFQ